MNYRLILFTLLISQFIPTFGGILGSSGNGIPLGVGFAGYFIGYLMYLTKGIPKSFFLKWTIIYMGGITFGLLATAMSPFHFALRDIAIVLKYATMYLALICGYMIYSRDPDYKPAFQIVIYVFLFHIVLYIDHLNNPNGSLQVLYHYKTSFGGHYGVNRFPGTWNFPYTVAIFLFSCVLAFLYRAFFTKSAIKRFLFFILACIGTYITIMGTQSRAAFLSVSFTFGYALLTFLLISLLLNKNKVFAITFGFVGLLVSGLIVFVQFLHSTFAQSEFRHLTKLVDSSQNVGAERINQINLIFNDFFGEHPWRLLIGYGSARETDYYIESIFNYLFNYGIIGTALIVGFWIYLWFKSGSMAFTSTGFKTKAGFLFVNIGLTYMFMMGMAGDMFTHFRFIPLFYLFAGMFLKHCELINMKKEQRIYRPMGYPQHVS